MALQWGRLRDEAEISGATDGDLTHEWLQWGRLRDEAEM